MQDAPAADLQTTGEVGEDKPTDLVWGGKKRRVNKGKFWNLSERTSTTKGKKKA